MTQLNIGDRVRPVSTFDLGFFNGPASHEDTGTVVGEWQGWPLVKWDEGSKENPGDFLEGSWDHTADEKDEDFQGFGVVKIEADAA